MHCEVPGVLGWLLPRPKGPLGGDSLIRAPGVQVSLRLWSALSSAAICLKCPALSHTADSQSLGLPPSPGPGALSKLVRVPQGCLPFVA